MRWQVRKQFSYMTNERFPSDWATAEIIKQYLKNRGKHDRRKAKRATAAATAAAAASSDDGPTNPEDDEDPPSSGTSSLPTQE